MGKLFKKTIAILLTLVMCIGLFPAATFAAESKAVIFDVTDPDANGEMTMTVTVNAPAAEKFWGFGFVLTYDNTVVDLASGAAINGGSRISDVENIHTSLSAMTIADTAVIGDRSAIAVQLGAGAETTLANVDVCTIDFKLAAGKTKEDMNKATFAIDIETGAGSFNKAFEELGMVGLYFLNSDFEGEHLDNSDIVAGYDYYNCTEGIRLATPTITIAPNTGNGGGIAFTITDTVNDPDFVEEYNVIVYKKSGDTYEVVRDFNTAESDVVTLNENLAPGQENLIAGQEYVFTVTALPKEDTDYSESAESAYSNVAVAAAKAAVATPSMTLEPNYGSNLGGFDYTITQVSLDKLNNYDYKITFYDGDVIAYEATLTAKKVHNTVNGYPYKGSFGVNSADAQGRMLTEGKAYTATVQVVADAAAAYGDSAESAPVGPVKAAYIQMADRGDITVDTSKVNDPIKPIVLDDNIKGGKAPYSFEVTGLPEGFKVVKVDGKTVIEGTPVAANKNSVTATVNVTDAQDTPYTEQFKVIFKPVQHDEGEIQVTTKNITMKYGDTVDLKPYLSVVEKIQPLANTEYKFEVTEGTDIVKVDANGVVTALKANAGDAKVTVTVVSDDAYTVEEPVTFNITVERRTVIINPKAGQSKVYGEEDPVPFRFTIDPATPLVEGDMLGDDILTRGGTNDVGEKEFVVKADVVNSFMDKYLITLAKDAPKFTIKPANGKIVEDEDAVTENFAITKTYGDPAFDLRGYNIANLSLLSRTYTYELTEGNDVVAVTPAGNVTILNAGVAKVVVTATDSNYNPIPAKEITITVEPKAVTVTADAKSKVYGQEDPALTWKAEGLVGKDKLTGITVTRAEGENVGEYAYTVTADVNRNYKVNADVQPNVFKITEAKGEVTVKEAYYEKTYGDAPFYLNENDENFGIKLQAFEPQYFYEVADEDVVTVDADGKVTIKGTGQTTVTVSAQSDNYSEIKPYEEITIYVNSADLEITPTVTSKVYGDAEPAITYTVEGLVYGEKAEDILGDSLTRAEGEDVGKYFFYPAKDLENYNWEIEGMFEILPRELTAVVDGAEITKAYDGTTAVTLPGIELEGVVGEDDVKLNAAAVYENQYAGTKAIDFTTWELTGDDVANYTLAAAPALTGSITAAAQEITPDSITVTIGSTVDLKTKVTVSGNGELTFASASELFTLNGTTMTVLNTTGEATMTVKAAEVYLNDDDKAEYAAAEKPVTVIVKDKEDVAVTMEGASVVYDGKAHDLKASVPAGFTGEWTYTYAAADDIAVVPAEGAPVHAGTYTVTATFENETHFGTATEILTIAQKEITVAMDDKAIVYNDDMPALTYKVTGVLANDGEVVTVTPSCEATAGSPVGTYAITGEVATIDSNYKLAGTVKPATLTIKKDDGKVEVEDGKAVYDKVYGDAPFSLTGFSISPLEVEETKYSFTVTSGKGVITVDETGLVTINKVGTEKVTVSATDHNYNVKQTTEVTINVAPRAVTVTPVAATKVYGEADPALTYTKSIDTLPNGKAVELNITLSRTGDDNVGTYDIVVKEGSNPNYTVTTESGVGKFTITQDEGKVDAEKVTYEKVYGDKDFALTGFSISVLEVEKTKFFFEVTEGTDVVTVNEAGVVHILNAGTAKVTVSATDHNFNVTQNKVVTINVAPKAVTVTADAKTKVFGEADPALTYRKSINTLPNGEAVELDITLSREAGEAAGTYAINVAEGSNPNYEITTVSGVFTISPKAVSEDMVTIEGTAAQNEALTVVIDSAVEDADPSYTWKVDGEVVSTSQDYTIPYGTVGTVTLEVTLGDNYSGTIVKTMEVPVLEITADLMISPVDATDGTTMTAELNNISPAVTLTESDYTITWKADDTVFATGNSVTLTTAQLGTTITAEAVSKDGSAYTFTATSNAVTVAAKAPVINELTTKVTKSSVTVTVDADPMGAATTYTAKLYKVADDTLVADVAMDGTTHTFSALTADTEYRIEVTATNEAGTDMEEVVVKTAKKAAGGGGGGGGSAKPDKEDKPVEETVKLPEVTVEDAEILDNEVDAGEVTAAEKEITKGAISAAKVDLDETKTTDKVAELKFDLSGEDVKDPENLTVVSYTTDENGEVVMKKLGGTYDPETKTFTAFIQNDGIYGVVEAEDLLKIELQIDNTLAEINDRPHMNDVAPVIANERTMVPLRFIAEAFGAKVTWDEPTKCVTIDLNGRILTLVIGKPIDGFDTPAMIMNDRTMVPIRYISESFGADVTWIAQTEQVIIVK